MHPKSPIRFSPPAIRRIAIAACAMLVLAGCDSIKTDPDRRTPQERTQERINPQGSIFTGRNTGGFNLLEGSGNRGGGVLPVNALIWRAALDTLSVVPLASVDTFSGSVITDWYPHPQGGNERIKVSVFVLDRELRSDAVRATVHLQKRDAGGNWIDAGEDRALATRLEDLILTRARELRSGSVTESN